MASVLAVKDSPYAWLSYAMACKSLIVDGPKDGDVKIEGFRYAAADGNFELVASVDGIWVGNGATDANLRKVFAVEGTAAIGDCAFSERAIEIKCANSENGKVRLTVAPKGEKPLQFFFKVKLK